MALPESVDETPEAPLRFLAHMVHCNSGNRKLTGRDSPIWVYYDCLAGRYGDDYVNIRVARGDQRHTATTYLIRLLCAGNIYAVSRLIGQGREVRRVSADTIACKVLR